MGGGAAPGRPPARPAGVPRQEGQGGRLQLSEGRTGADRLCRHRGLQVMMRLQPPSHRLQYQISRSRLAGEDPKAVSNKLDFQSFKKHYDSYTVAQALFNKMIKIL